MTLIDIVDVTKTFGEVVALDDVSLAIGENEFFALLGPSGCGKTTLLRILAGFEEPDSGHVLLDGADLVGIKPYRRPVNMMFQSYALFPHMTVYDNVGYGLKQEGRPRLEIEERVSETLEKVDMADLARRKPHQLSGGQKQRVALARAVVKNPRVLLLDEPLAALDRKIRGEMQLELKRMQHQVGITFVFVTHDQEEAMSMADRIAVMDEGRVLQVDTPVQLYERPTTHFVADFIGTMNFFEGEAADEGVVVPGIGLLRSRPHDAAVGSRVRLAVRPEKLDIIAGPGETRGNRLEGTVEDVSFYGAQSHCSIRVGGRTEPVKVTSQGPLQLPLGAVVTVTWPPEDSLVLL